MPIIQEISIHDIAKFLYEINRAYCRALGDDSHLPWERAPGWQRKSVIEGVMFHIGHPESTPKDSHDSWLRRKEKDGWSYGPVKDPENKKHPCFVPYDDLPESQKAKDFIFKAVVEQFISLDIEGREKRCDPEK